MVVVSTLLHHSHGTMQFIRIPVRPRRQKTRARRVQAYSVVKVMLRGWKQSLVEIISGIAASTSVRFPRAHSFRLILSG